MEVPGTCECTELLWEVSLAWMCFWLPGLILRSSSALLDGAFPEFQVVGVESQFITWEILQPQALCKPMRKRSLIPFSSVFFFFLPLF